MDVSQRKMAFWGVDNSLKLYVRSCGNFILVPGDAEQERRVDFGEIFWVISGCGKFFDGEKEYRIKPGMVWYYPPDSFHKYYPIDTFHYCWVSVAGEYAEDFFRITGLVPGVNRAGDCPVHLFTTIVNELEIHTGIHRNNALNTAFQILNQIPLRKRKSTASRPAESMAEVRSYIESAYSDPHLSVERLAENLNMHRGSLSRSFHQIYNISISDYIIHTRLQAATSMLIESEHPIWEIAENCGFSSSNYFTKVFTAKTLLTPKNFRKKYKSEK